MSVSDPLLKEIKACTLKFLQEASNSGVVTDDNQDLLVFCHAIEKIFNFGLLPQQNGFGFIVKNGVPWNWLERLGNTKHGVITFAYSDSVDKVRQNCTVQTSRGKFRLLVRLCLAKGCLHVPIEFLVRLRRTTFLYHQNSVIGDEILCEILLSVLLQCSKLNFNLDVKNASFLDITWRIPQVLRFEFVPCDSLGLSISFAGEKAIIVHVRSDSVVAENGQIQVGDVLDGLNNVYICAATKGRLASIFRNTKKQPVHVTIVKAVNSATNELFPPMIKLLKEVDLDPIAIRERRISAEPASNLTQTISPGFHVTYLGKVEVGKQGDTKQIDKAGKLLLSPYKTAMHDFTIHEKVKKKASFEIGEIGIKVVDVETKQILLKHSYMEISSCASITGLSNYFGYIAGNENCSTASNFVCYMFHSKNTDDADTILQSIGQGFHRTHFAV